MNRPVFVAVALGSNLGDRRAHLTWAVEQLTLDLASLRVSDILETEAQDVPDAQPPYLNAVAVGETTLSPRDLLDHLLTLEQRRGRTRATWRAARTLDLDLILFGDSMISEPDLIVPHPHYRQRAFVLEPLAQLVPGRIDPVTKKTMAEMLAVLGEGGAGVAGK